MIDLNKPFTLANVEPRDTFQLAGTFNGIKGYFNSNKSKFLIDILSKRGATVYTKDNNKFYVDGQEFHHGDNSPTHCYGVLIQDHFQYSIMPSNEEVVTSSAYLNVSIPMVALKGTGSVSIDAVAGPYLVDFTYKRYYPADTQDTFKYKTYQVIPALSSQLVTSKKIQESTDLNVAPETPPENNLLPNLFTNIKSGNYRDTYVKDNDHKINITLTHTSSHG